MFTLEDYYARSEVRQRMVEFLGGRRLDDATCVYVTADSAGAEPALSPRPAEELWDCLDQGLEVMRSLWDRESVLIHLDVEYVNFDYPAEPYLDPQRAMELQRPVLRILQEILLSHGIVPLHLLSGRGHHLVWRARRDSAAFHRLAELGHVVETLGAVYRAAQPPRGEVVGEELGAAFAGAGQLLEYLAHEVLRRIGRLTPVPIHLTEVETPRGQRGREIVSVDLSEYGDPVSTRMVRIPFSVYHKPEQTRSKLGGHIVDELPPLFPVPLFETDEGRALAAMRDPLQAAELARFAPTFIPDHSDGTGSLVAAYTDSPTAGFHRWFYSQEQEPPAKWPESYDRTPLEALPACARRILLEPNDLLLKPASMRHLVRVFMALGWHPRHIAGLIRSKFERDYGWGDQFYHYDAAARADFYTRLFAGLIVEGIDDLDDFRCEDMRALDYCQPEQCDRSLSGFHESLTQRRHHERLAGRPVHGLFLPDQHL